MKMSKLFVQTLREFPADAEVISHKMLARAGYIKKLASGVYNYLPLMWRVLKKIENIVRDEMDNAEAQELLMPFVQPQELWEESGRWDVYGKELMRLKDRHDRGMCLGPTHEEVITAIARDGIKSYKQMPVNLYQIQSKFRDEIRPRFGLLRGREFLMKDAYSFDVDESGLEKEYQNMAQAYTKIFNRCGLETKMVQSDSGAIGGSVSHEFMVITTTDSGENDVFYCEKCDYAANSDHAVSKLPEAVTDGGFEKAEIIDTPNTKTIEDLTEFLKIAPTVILKTLVYIADKKPVLVLIRADKTVEETKLKNALNAKELRISSEAEIQELMAEKGFDAKAGFIGPVGIKGVWTIADNSIKDLKNFVVGCNQTDKHLIGANFAHEVPEIKDFYDIRLVEKGEICPVCSAKLNLTRGIEVGNIFKLGTKYSKPMKAVFTDIDGKEKPYVMGCYGIGISRTAAAAVERYHDENGIMWPVAIAPYHVIVVPLNIKDELQMKFANEIYTKLSDKGVEVVLDDRDERPGVKFKDADLIGFPYRITVGKTIQKENGGLVEFKTRATGEMVTLTPEAAVKKLMEELHACGIF
ncbi:MAG: proline--tRNA ligase [Candidatus Gastranaerophilaceae bacterium]